MHMDIVGGNLIITIPLHHIGKRTQSHIRVPKLTKQQRKVFDLMRRGKVAKEIGVAIDITTRTAKHHIGDVYKRCNVSDRMEFAQYF